MAAQAASHGRFDEVGPIPAMVVIGRIFLSAWWRCRGRVVLGTPSAAPPGWTGQRWPKIHRADGRGQRHAHGIRAEVSLTAPIDKTLVAQIVTAMAEHHGQDPRVRGWQIDNEPSTFPDASGTGQRAGLEGRLGVFSMACLPATFGRLPAGAPAPFRA